MKTCILTIIKNEQEYLEEWIQYHINIGIDHIFIFEDIDSDSHKSITDKFPLDKVSLNSILNVFDSDDDKNEVINLKKEGKGAQFKYSIAGLKYIQKNYSYYDWCFVIDNDEFITLQEGKSLQDVIYLYKDYDAFILQWKNYGANGLVKKPNYSERGVIETYTKPSLGKIPIKLGGVILTKPCFNLRTFKETFYWNNHQPNDTCKWCKTNFSRNRHAEVFDNIYIRHYITKSWEEYVWKKNNRGYFFGKTRTKDLFFILNPDMADKKDELINDLEKETLVVLPYKQGGAQGNEIKLMLNGWKKFCNFKYRFIVIGEFNESIENEFPWVEFIRCETKPKIEGQYNPHLDIQNKFNVIHKLYSQKYEGFIYATDDEYAIKPFTLEDILITHYHSPSFSGREDQPTWFWNHDKWKTRQLLDKENLPHINYTTHYPAYFEFNKLKEIRDKFNMLNESYVFDDVYFNYFPHEEPVLDSTIRLGIWSKSIFKNDFQKAVDNPNIKFVCNSVEGWSRELEDELWKIVKQ